VTVEQGGALRLIRIHRPDVHNAMDGPAAEVLAEACHASEADEQACVAVLAGAGEHFCAGAELRAVASG
jgi:enoyl-CoA hydratase